MKRIIHTVKFILAVYFGLITLIGFVVLYPAFLFTLSNPKRYSYGHWLRKVWGRWLFLCGLIRVKQIMEVPLDKSKAYVIAPNHTSMLDIITLTVKLNLDFNFMAKKELAEIPVFGIFFRTIDIAVDRKNARNAALAYQKAKDQLTKDKKSIVIFPQGTISKTTPLLSKFKDGAFKMAIETQTDILPVTLIGNWKVLPDFGQLHFMPGKVVQYVHTPVSTKGMTEEDLPALKQKVFDIIAAKLAEYGYFE